jgi:hypothetical protein
VKRLVEFPLEEGGSILVEVDEPESESGLTRAGRPSEIPAEAGQTFESALERLRPAAGAIIAKLRGLADPPDEVQVEFGLTMSAAAGMVVASASAEANYRVTLTWRRGEQNSE